MGNRSGVNQIEEECEVPVFAENAILGTWGSERPVGRGMASSHNANVGTYAVVIVALRQAGRRYAGLRMR